MTISLLVDYSQLNFETTQRNLWSVLFLGGMSPNDDGQSTNTRPRELSQTAAGTGRGIFHPQFAGGTSNRSTRRAVGDVSPMAISRQQTPVARGIAETFTFGDCQSRRTGDTADRKGVVVIH
jgi:hypothetical protein